MTFTQVIFTRSDRTARLAVPARDRVHAQHVADVYGRKGWILKDIVDAEHDAKVFYGGPTLFESNNGLGSKHAWVFVCNCGDEDTTGYKADAVKIAKLHTQNVRVFNKVSK